VSAINPFSGYVAQGTQVERLQAAEKTRQVRREQTLSKNVAAQDDQLEHQVESADAIVSIHDDQQQQNPQQHQSRQEQPQPEDGEEPPPHIDITA
jgi:hypothetical protein